MYAVESTVYLPCVNQDPYFRQPIINLYSIGSSWKTYFIFLTTWNLQLQYLDWVLDWKGSSKYQWLNVNAN